MIPYLDTVITQNLIKESKDMAGLRHTLLFDERCQLCGAELSRESRQHHVLLCGSCTRKIPRKAYCISDVIHRINKAHGDSFYNAFDSAFGLR